MRTVIFGNSGSGKSTLASRLAREKNLHHLDLDTIAWQDCSPPTRLPLIESEEKILSFINKSQNWVIEGCYSSLL